MYVHTYIYKLVRLHWKARSGIPYAKVPTCPRHDWRPHENGTACMEQLQLLPRSNPNLISQHNINGKPEAGITILIIHSPFGCLAFSTALEIPSLMHQVLNFVNLESDPAKYTVP